jgi:NADH:flavin oxidoreductases, Old Yellow Enzyme family
MKARIGNKYQSLGNHHHFIHTTYRSSSSSLSVATAFSFVIHSKRAFCTEKVSNSENINEEEKAKDKEGIVNNMNDDNDNESCNVKEYNVDWGKKYKKRAIASPKSSSRSPPKLFTPLSLRSLELKNRIMVSPMFVLFFK